MADEENLPPPARGVPPNPTPAPAAPAARSEAAKPAAAAGEKDPLKVGDRDMHADCTGRGCESCGFTGWADQAS